MFLSSLRDVLWLPFIHWLCRSPALMRVLTLVFVFNSLATLIFSSFPRLEVYTATSKEERRKEHLLIITTHLSSFFPKIYIFGDKFILQEQFHRKYINMDIILTHTYAICVFVDGSLDIFPSALRVSNKHRIEQGML